MRTGYLRALDAGSLVLGSRVGLHGNTRSKTTYVKIQIPSFPAFLISDKLGKSTEEFSFLVSKEHSAYLTGLQ